MSHEIPDHQRSLVRYLDHETEGDELRSLFETVLDALPHSVALSPWAMAAAHHWWASMEPKIEWPAAQTHHHAWPGGLYVHTTSVAVLAIRYACWLQSQLETEIDFDVLTVAALFHDVGKLFEVNQEPGGAYSDEGGAVGHIAISKMRWGVVARDVDAPLGSSLHVEHCIDAHHSNAGPAAVQPRTVEALILSMADSMDSRVVGFLDALALPKSDRPRHFRHGVRWRDLNLNELAAWSLP